MAVTIITKSNDRVPVRVPADKHRPNGFVNGEDWVVTSAMGCIPGSIGWDGNEVCYSSQGEILRLEHAETGALIYIKRNEVSYMEVMKDGNKEA